MAADDCTFEMQNQQITDKASERLAKYACGDKISAKYRLDCQISFYKLVKR
ncbi:MAG: hypothetical protein ACI4MI_02820 [Christensenellales bacterium]